MSDIISFDQSPLPLTRMESLLPDTKIKYQEGVPFPHIVFDDFFDDNVVEKVLSEFPGKNDIDWIDYYDGDQVKLANEKESNIKVPEIVTFVFQIIIFLIPSLIVLSKEFNFELTSILATSGVLAAILGFAIQANLSNMLSGIFVNIERPFSQNDWITIDDKTGFVIDVTWRSTRIRTFENIEVTIPNEVVANAVIVNWSKNDKERMSEGFHIFNKLHFHPKHDPQHISQLLYNALKKVKPIDDDKENI